MRAWLVHTECRLLRQLLLKRALLGGKFAQTGANLSDIQCLLISHSKA